MEERFGRCSASIDEASQESFLLMDRPRRQAYSLKTSCDVTLHPWQIINELSLLQRTPLLLWLRIYLWYFLVPISYCGGCPTCRVENRITFVVIPRHPLILMDWSSYLQFLPCFRWNYILSSLGSTPQSVIADEKALKACLSWSSTSPRVEPGALDISLLPMS